MFGGPNLLFRPHGPDRFRVLLPPESRELVASVARQLGGLLDDPDAPEVRRLFPPAYTDDPDREAGFQVFARSELIDTRREAAEVVMASVDDDELTHEQLGCWMRIVTDARLVLGTSLDVSEDEDLPSPEDPTYDGFQFYRWLSYLLEEIVAAMQTTLD